jgi:hypothetical protein
VGTSTATSTAAVKHVIVETQALDEMRYDTVGDWVYVPDRETLYIYVADLGDWRANMAVAMHEQAEAMQCLDRGISQEEVEVYDLSHLDSEDPGSDDAAPYHLEHEFAEWFIERPFIGQFMSQQKYDRMFQRLPKWRGKLVGLGKRLADLTQEPRYETENT